MYHWRRTLLFLCVMVSVHCSRATDKEGSGEVCNVEGSTCPEDKCCRDAECGKDKDTEGLKCCNVVLVVT